MGLVQLSARSVTEIQDKDVTRQALGGLRVGKPSVCGFMSGLYVSETGPWVPGLQSAFWFAGWDFAPGV